MVVGTRQSFQFFRQKAWFLQNNRALPKFLCRVSYYLTSIYYQIMIKSVNNQQLTIKNF